MIAPGRAECVSAASLRCARALPATVVASSLACGWTSLLVERHRVEPDGEPFETLPTPDQTIVVMLAGEQDLACLREGRWRHALYRPGTIGMTPGGESDRLRRLPRKAGGTRASFEKANLYLPQAILRQAAEHYRRAGQRCHRSLAALAFQDPVVAQTAVALLRAMTAGQPDLYAATAAHWLAAHLVTTREGRLDSEVRTPGLIADRRLARVLEFMSARQGDALTLDELATEAGVSKFHFTRLFRAATGRSPVAFLFDLRMEAARDLLLGTGASVQEVAARCGFARAASFGTAFTRRFGLSPTAFRARRSRE